MPPNIWSSSEMGPKGAMCDFPPLTNRGVQVTQAWFRGVGTTWVPGHDSGQIEPCERR